MYKVLTDFAGQGRRENSRSPGQNYIWGPYDVIILLLKTGGLYCKALRNPSNGPFMTYTRLNFDGALLNLN